jgi:hypothetical protein
VDYFVDAAYFREMPEPLRAAFSASYAFLQNSCCKVTPHFPSVLKAVRHSLRCAVDTNRHSIDLRIDDSLREGVAGKWNKAQLQAIDNRFFGFAIDSHPSVSGIMRKNAMPGERRLKAHKLRKEPKRGRILPEDPGTLPRFFAEV